MKLIILIMALFKCIFPYKIYSHLKLSLIVHKNYNQLFSTKSCSILIITSPSPINPEIVMIKVSFQQIITIIMLIKYIRMYKNI
jgi:hypothetical protein